MQSAAASATRTARSAAAVVGLVSAMSLLLQYALLLRLERDGVGPALATLRFFSYFTILSNLFVVAATGSVAFAWKSRIAVWLTRPRTLAAIALYIAITGAIYVAILRHLWQPQGAQWWADTGLHYATPALYLAWWLFAAAHGALRWRDLGAWLVFPALYLLWCFLRGAWVHEYPYPFIDVAALGIPTALRNAAGVCVLFLVVGAVLIPLDRLLGASRKAGSIRSD